MDIKTKFDLGQRVFFMSDNRVCQGVIEGFDIGFGYRGLENDITISYCVKAESFTDLSVEENKLFLTKEELLKSL